MKRVAVTFTDNEVAWYRTMHGHITEHGVFNIQLCDGTTVLIPLCNVYQIDIKEMTDEDS